MRKLKKIKAVQANLKNKEGKKRCDTELERKDMIQTRMVKLNICYDSSVEVFLAEVSSAECTPQQ